MVAVAFESAKGHNKGFSPAWANRLQASADLLAAWKVVEAELLDSDIPVPVYFAALDEELENVLTTVTSGLTDSVRRFGCMECRRAAANNKHAVALTQPLPTPLHANTER